MNGILLLIPLLAFGVGMAYAEPLQDIQTSVSDYDDNSVTVQFDWNHDGMVKKYQVGCVSCIPNVVEFSTEDNVTMKNVTAFPNSPYVMLYIIVYDWNDEVFTAKQILLDIWK